MRPQFDAFLTLVNQRKVVDRLRYMESKQNSGLSMGEKMARASAAAQRSLCITRHERCLTFKAFDDEAVRDALAKSTAHMKSDAAAGTHAAAPTDEIFMARVVGERCRRARVPPAD